MNIMRCRAIGQTVPNFNNILDGNRKPVEIARILPDCPRTRGEVTRGGAEFQDFEQEMQNCFRSIESFTPNPQRNPQLQNLFPSAAI